MADDRKVTLNKGDQGHQESSEGRHNNTPQERSDEERKRDREKSHPEDLKGPLSGEEDRSGTHMDQ